MARARAASTFRSPPVSSAASAGGEGGVEDPAHVVQQRLGNGLAAEGPDHRAQLGLHVEGQAVVDGVDGAVRSEQAVAALAVGVVGEEVEDAHAPEAVVVGGVLDQGEEMLLEVGVHEELERSLSVGAVPLDGQGDEPPAQRLGEEIGGDLALVEPGGKVPERPLAALRLVDGQRGGAVQGQLGQERGVAAPRHAALHPHRAGGQDGGRVRGRGRPRAQGLWPFLRGQRCPPGSMGPPHT